MSDEQEYIAAIGAVRCVKCANYHFDDTAICWHCQDDGCRITCCDQIVDTIDGEIGL
jgi:uncharacterized OB-fold protein